MELNRNPGLKTAIRKHRQGGFTATLTTKKPALWTWLELEGEDAKLSDNFFHLRPGQPVTVTIDPAKTLTLTQVREKLVAKSLVDTYA
jgi:beta-mannosidase